MLPNNPTIVATSQRQLSLSEQCSSKAKKAMILPGLHSALLISTRQVCDDGYTVVLNNKKLIAIKGDNIMQHLLKEKSRT